MVLPENVEELSLADMEKSSEEEEAKGRIFTDERSFTNPNLRKKKQVTRRSFINTDFSVTLHSLCATIIANNVSH